MYVPHRFTNALALPFLYTSLFVWYMCHPLEEQWLICFQLANALWTGEITAEWPPRSGAVFYACWSRAKFHSIQPFAHHFVVYHWSYFLGVGDLLERVSITGKIQRMNNDDMRKRVDAPLKVFSLPLSCKSWLVNAYCGCLILCLCVTYYIIVMVSMIFIIIY